MRYQALDPVRLLPGVGPKNAEHLGRMGIESINDLLYWFPRRYLDGSAVTPIAQLRSGELAAVRAIVQQVDQRRTKSRGLKMQEVIMSDNTGELVVRWFNQPYLLSKLVPGSRWTLIGVPKWFNGELMMASPLIESEPRIIPIYAQTKGITSRLLSNYVAAALPNVDLEQADLPAEIRAAEKLIERRVALHDVHLPTTADAITRAKEYLAFEEAFAFFMAMQKAKQGRVQERGIALKTDVEWLKNVIAGLPFDLTNGQKRVLWDSLKEMESGTVMTRLLNGDVGSGKTVIAALLAAVVAMNGYRTAILVPTEILAKQHFESISSLLKTAGVRVALWTAAQKDQLEDANLVIGTHALLQEGVTLEKLALIVVDEQHRFGVKQRAMLREGQAQVPHLLSMTATPIPRTLALVLFADLTVSFLTDKPKNRLPIETVIASPGNVAGVHARIMEELGKKHQIFVICPLIEEKAGKSDSPDAGPTLFDVEETKAQERKTVLAEVERLRKEHPEYGTIEAVHGKMKPAEKRAIMERMGAGEIQVLVSTSVIEVGVDIPNATVMVIEGAERFGLAQLHQFRGRVGRGTDQSYCFLLPSLWNDKIADRLSVLVESDSGFDVAEKDLAVRGPGDITGLAQSGLPDFRMASLSDIEYLQHVKEVTEKFVREHPDYLEQYTGIHYSHATGSLE